MKVGIIIGSHRRQSQSAKVGQWLSSRLIALAEVEQWTLDLGKTPLPLWDEEMGSDAPRWAPVAPLKAQLATTDALIVISPEWHGMVPAALKNFFLLCTGVCELAHKPALACAVSASDGGAYVISELRASSYKNSRLCWIPEHLIVRQVRQLANEDGSENNASLHSAFATRADYALRLLLAYGDALQQVRATGLIDHDAFLNGM